MAPRKNKQPETSEQRMRRKSNPRADSEMMRLHQQINAELSASLNRSIQTMVNKILRNIVARDARPNSTSDNARPSRDSSASDDEGPSNIDGVNQNTSS